MKKDPSYVQLSSIRGIGLNGVEMQVFSSFYNRVWDLFYQHRNLDVLEGVLERKRPIIIPPSNSTLKDHWYSLVSTSLSLDSISRVVSKFFNKSSGSQEKAIRAGIPAWLQVSSSSFNEKNFLFQVPTTHHVGIGYIAYSSVNHTYILLGRENYPDPQTQNTWSPCGGWFEAHKHRDIADTILEEVAEESAGQYFFTREKLEEPDVLTYSYTSRVLRTDAQKSSGIGMKKAFAFFSISLAEFKTESELELHVTDDLPEDFKEKNQFAWVCVDDDFFSQLSHLCYLSTHFDHQEVDILDIEGYQMKINLRNSFVEDLVQPEIQKRLKYLRYKSL